MAVHDGPYGRTGRMQLPLQIDRNQPGQRTLRTGSIERNGDMAMADVTETRAGRGLKFAKFFRYFQRI